MRAAALLSLVRDGDSHGYEGGRLDDERDLRLAMLWQVQPRALRAVRSWVRAGQLPFPWTDHDLGRLAERLPAGLREGLRRLPGLEDARRLRGELEKLAVRFLHCEEGEFPERLRRISDPPPYLFLRGDPFGQMERPRVGVIGARAASEGGREIAYTLARDLSLAGCTVVSGLARGIDGEAHRGALESGGRTVAVLGTGPDVCYPGEHAPMFRSILERGGLVTEFPPGAPVRPLHFPRRNRILAALCDALVIVEGSEKSGARSTVDFALEQGTEVLAVPRDILHPGSVLPNRLLRDGAAPVVSVGDILQALPPDRIAPGLKGAEPGSGSDAIPASPPGASGGAQLEPGLWDLLAAGPCPLEACLCAFPGIGAAAVQSVLSRWEILGRVTRIPGGRWARTT